MTTRPKCVLLGQVWQTGAFAVFPVAFLLAGITLIADAELWRHEWGWAFGQWSGLAQVLSPVVGGAAAWDVSRLANRRTHWLVSTARGPQALLLGAAPALGMGFGILSVSALVIVFYGSRHSATAPIPWLAIASAAACVLIAGGLGAAVGRTWPHPIAVGLVPLVLWALSVGGRSVAGLGDLFGLDAATTSLAGLHYVPQIIWLRMAGLSVLALLALAVLTPREWRLWELWRRGAAVAAAAALFAGGLAGIWTARDDVGPDPSARASECRGQRPLICYSPTHSYLAPMAAGELRRFDEALSSLDLRLGAMIYTEELPGKAVRGDSVPFTLTPGMVTGDVAESAIYSGRCFRRLITVLDEPLDRAVMLVALWVRAKVGAQLTGPEADTLAAAQLESPAAEGRAWLNSTISALRECRLSDVRPPSVS